MSVYRLLSRDNICALTMTLAAYHGFDWSLYPYDQDHVCFRRPPCKRANLRGMNDVARTLACQKVSCWADLTVNIPGQCADGGNADYLGPGQ